MNKFTTVLKCIYLYTHIKFIFAIAIDVLDYNNPMIVCINRGKKRPLATIVYKQSAKNAGGICNCVIYSPINFIFGIAIDNT